MLALVALTACSRTEPTPESVRAVRTVVVSPALGQAVLEYSAEIRARSEMRLSFRVGGKLVDRPAQLGDSVRKGHVLARLDPQDLRLAEAAAKAAMQATEVNSQQAQADLARFENLFQQGFISAAELERRRTAASAAKAQLAQVQAQSEVQSRQSTYGSLIADADGVITAVDAEPGAVLAAGMPVLRLAANGPRDALFFVPEDQVESVRKMTGLAGAVQLRTWGEPAHEFKATVREVAAAADAATRTFAVRAAVAANSGGPSVRLGQTAAVRLSPHEARPVIKLPTTAVLQQQGQTAVWVLDAASMTVKLQPVSLAGADGNEIIVSQGLQPGQEVVTAGVHVLTAGQQVKRYVDGRTASVGAPASR
jgi:RND family efflux transporter MFP subunit